MYTAGLEETARHRRTLRFTDTHPPNKKAEALRKGACPSLYINARQALATDLAIGNPMNRRFISANGNAPSGLRRVNILKSLVQAINRKAFNSHPIEPWIPFSAASALNNIINDRSVVWEVGAGYSTLWLARRAKHVVSIEADKHWHDRLTSEIDHRGIENVDLRYRWHGHEMSSYDRDDIDLLYIDGGPRSDCLINGVRYVRPGGYVYLDNTDVLEFWKTKDPFAINDDVKSRVLWQEVHIDYVPAMVGVSEGILARLK